jgi:hypothetical protein
VNAAQPSRWSPLVTAFAIWFVHFMVCWAAGEIWPHRWPANGVAWVATPIALLAMGAHLFRVSARHADGTLEGWQHRFAQGAIAIATVAVLFTALPSIVFRP